MWILRAARSLLLLPGLMLFGPLAFAQLDTDTTTFAGTVDGTCTITNATTDNTVALTNDSGTLTGVSGNIEIAANVAVKLFLSDLALTASPNGSAPVAQATLDDVDAGNGDDWLVADRAANGDEQYDVPKALGSATDNTSYTTHLDLTVTDATVPGTYTCTILLSCLQV